jgi:hypothetical protein
MAVIETCLFSTTVDYMLQLIYCCLMTAAVNTIICVVGLLATVVFVARIPGAAPAVLREVAAVPDDKLVIDVQLPGAGVVHGDERVETPPPPLTRPIGEVKKKRKLLYPKGGGGGEGGQVQHKETQL